MKFVDSSFLISFYHKKSIKHEKSRIIFKKLSGEELAISYMVIAEVLTILRKLKANDDLVKKAYSSMINSMIVLDDTSFYEESFKASLANDVGFFNNLYHVLMVDLGINEIVSFDSTFDIFDDMKRVG